MAFHPLRVLATALWALVGCCAATAFAGEQVTIETSKGVVLVELFPQQAPATVANFLSHVDAGFYDGLVFHRVVPGFVVQTGGFDTELKKREPLGSVKNESVGGLHNERGTLAMARLADPDSATSQFYINLRANPNLDALGAKPGYTVFGRVVQGMDVVDEISFVKTGVRAEMEDVPLENVVIQSVRRVSAGH